MAVTRRLAIAATIAAIGAGLACILGSSPTVVVVRERAAEGSRQAGSVLAVGHTWYGAPINGYGVNDAEVAVEAIPSWYSKTSRDHEVATVNGVQ